MDRLRSLVGGLDRWSMRHRVTRVSRAAIGGFLRHDALQFAGSMAYFSVLSLFQLLVLAVAIGSLFLDQARAREFVLDQVTAGSPIDRDTIAAVIDAAVSSRGSLTIIGFALLLWGALGIFSSLSTGINRAFENAPPRPFLLDKLVGLLLMAVTGLLAVASLVIGLVTGVLQQAASDLIGEMPGGETGVWLIGLLAPMILIFLAFLVIYRVVPNRRVSWGEVLPGAVVATVLWTLLRFGFTWYATSVANYESAFGPLSTGITLIVFLYFASVIVLIGAEFARASVVDDEIGAIRVADPRLLPVPTEALPAPARPSVRGRLRWVPLAVAGLLGVIIGRISKRDE
jgi:membrane protein